MPSVVRTKNQAILKKNLEVGSILKIFLEMGSILKKFLEVGLILKFFLELGSILKKFLELKWTSVWYLFSVKSCKSLILRTSPYPESRSKIREYVFLQSRASPIINHNLSSWV